MLIIEGPDLVGKTTLAQAMLKEWNENPRKYGSIPAIYNHFSRLPDRWHYFKSYLPYMTKYTVQDRFHHSEIAYGKACRGKINIDGPMLRMLDAHLALLGSVTVQVTCDPQLLAELWQRKNREEMFALAEVLEVNELYEKGLQAEGCWATVDFAFKVEMRSGAIFWPADDRDWIEQVLREWARRLNFINGHCGHLGSGFYEGPSREIKEALT